MIGARRPSILRRLAIDAASRKSHRLADAELAGPELLPEVFLRRVAYEIEELVDPALGRVVAPARRQP